MAKSTMSKKADNSESELQSDDYDVFPFGLPPPDKSLDELIEENLLHPERLPIHSLDVSQRFLPAETCLENLYSVGLSEVCTGISMVRDHKTGKLIGFTEELLDGAGRSGKLSLNRDPAPTADIRGKNIPFWPGGFDDTEEDIVDGTLATDAELLDFDNDLLTVPPGLSRGLDFPRCATEFGDGTNHREDSHVISLTDVLQFDAGDAVFDWLHDDMAGDKEQQDEMTNSLHDQVDSEDAADHVESQKEVDDSYIETMPASSTPTDRIHVSAPTDGEEWVIMVDCQKPVTDFYKRIPFMAHTWPFELDPFQKQAILHLENNNNVFVAAHTSAGKTVVAEYAVALSLQHLTRTIYTSPIKALSNQKFRDFRETFGEESVGLVTGDVQINTSASCLIMTTEILRSMLYRGSEVIRDLEWVIFDEVHYINNTERGVVWEEVLIMLPSHVNIVLLSATVPNTKEFASWVGKTKCKTIFVMSTVKRPVPLEHHLYTGNSDKTSKELFLLVDSEGQFLTKGYDKAVAAKKERESKSASSFGPRGQRDGHPQQDRSTWLSLIKMLERTDRLPAVAFTFSKKKIDEIATNLNSVDLTTNREKSAIHSFIHTSINRLRPPDRLLPQVTKMEDLLKRGLAIHHSGILPILKEVVELLFQRGLIKVLFATETFAMGVNMPARTVLFDSVRKHDGTQLRMLHTAEYIQMAGRAGRRGIDTTGTVIILCKGDVTKSADLHHMILGKPTKLESHFRLTYSMILNLCRVEQLRMEDMMKRSFTEFHAQSDHSKHRANIESLRDQISALQDIVCLPCATDLDLYYADCKEYCNLRNVVWGSLVTHQTVAHSLSSGRLVQIQVDKYSELLAIILTAWRRQAKDSPVFTVLAICDAHIYPSLSVVELPDLIYNDESLPIVKRSLYRPDGAPWHALFTCELQHISVITTKTLKIEAEIIINDVKKRHQHRFRDDLPISQVTTVTQEMHRFLHEYPQCLPALDPVKDFKIREIDLVEQLRSLRMIGRRIDDYNCVTCPLLDEHFSEMHKQKVLKSKYNRLKFLLSEDSLSLLPEYTNRIKVLKELNFLDPQGRIQLKGRVACEISSATILTSQLILENVLENLVPAEIAALLSCIVFQERRASEPKLTESLQRGMESIIDIADRISDIQKLNDVRIDGEDYDLHLNFGLMEVVYEWARGMPFKDITELTDVQEGVIVRTIQRLHEVLRDVKDAARIIGNPRLYDKMSEASTLIKRDIVFAASLYTQ